MSGRSGCLKPSLLNLQFGEDGARHRPASVNNRQHRQATRIFHGVKSGEITKSEAGRLRAEEASIRAEERVYRRSGGHLTKWEIRDLQRDLNQTSRDIFRTTHNDRDRGDR